MDAVSNRLWSALFVAVVLLLMSAESTFATIRPPVNVPEPASMTLLAVGGVSAYLFRRRRS